MIYKPESGEMVYVFDFGKDTSVEVTVQEETRNGSLTTTLHTGVRKGSREDAALDAFESFLLAAACKGIISADFRDVAETTYEAICNHYGE